MFRRILPLAMLVMLAILAVVFFTGREGQFAAAASRLPDRVLYEAESLRSDVKGSVVILQDIVIDDDEPATEEPVVLKADVPADGAVSDGAADPASDAALDTASDTASDTAPGDG